MALRKNQSSGEPEQKALHRSNIGSLQGAATLGAQIARHLDAYGMGVAILDEDGFVRFVDPSRVRIIPPTEDEIIAKMVDDGASDEQIQKVLELHHKEWEKARAQR